jgi:hypothetical protein
VRSEDVVEPAGEFRVWSRTMNPERTQAAARRPPRPLGEVLV